MNYFLFYFCSYKGLIFMHLDQLLLILDLAQTHSFNQTAERHYTTQQTVSYRIKQLEKELNVKIFNRSKNGVSFTHEGNFVLQFAEQMQNAYQELQHNLGHEVHVAAEPEKLTLYTSSVLLTEHMPSIIQNFNSTFPSIKLFIKEVTNDTILPSLLDGVCDMVVWSINQSYLEKNISSQQAKEITFHTVLHDKSIAVVSATSALAKKEKLSTDDITQCSKSVFGLLPIDYFGKNVNSYILYENDNPAIHRQLLAEENTLCFTSEIMYRQFFPSDQFVARQFDYPVLPNYHMVLRRKDENYAALDALEHIIVRYLRA